MTTYLVTKAGNDNNGGTSAAIRATRTDGVTNGTNTLTSAGAAFVSGDIGHGIFIGGVNQWRLVTAVGSGTSLTFSGATIASASGRTFTIGGAWLTVAKPLSATGIASGDTVWIGSGTYRETIVLANTNPTAETKVLGDVDGSHTGSAPGRVIITAYTTNDTTAPAAATTLGINSRDYMTFEDLIIVGGNASPECWGNANTSTNVTFRRCVFQATYLNGCTAIYVAFGVAASYLIEDCAFSGIGNELCYVSLGVSASGADYDAGVEFRNCLFVGASVGVSVDAATNTFKGGGVKVIGCTRYGYQLVYVQRSSTSIPVRVYGCLVYSSPGTGLYAAVSGQVIEDYNVIHSYTPRTNVTAGTNSKSTAIAVMVALGLESRWGLAPLPLGAPIPGSPLLGFGSNGSYSSSNDLTGKPRPAGGGSTAKGVGAWELHDTAAKETTTTDSGNAIKVTGPGDQEFQVPVTAASTTISITCRVDATASHASPPQVLLLANGEIGVAAQTLTATPNQSAFETLTFSAFTPTAVGVVTIRLLNRTSSGTGVVYFDTVSVT